MQVTLRNQRHFFSSSNFPTPDSNEFFCFCFVVVIVVAVAIVVVLVVVVFNYNEAPVQRLRK